VKKNEKCRVPSGGFFDSHCIAMFKVRNEIRSIYDAYVYRRMLLRVPCMQCTYCSQMLSCYTTDYFVQSGTEHQYTVWTDATRPGVMYRLCTRRSSEVTNTTSSTTLPPSDSSTVTAADDGDADHNWSTITLFTERMSLSKDISLYSKLVC